MDHTQGTKPSKNSLLRREMWPIGRLKPYAANAREHSKTQVRRLISSIRRFGLNKSITVDADGTVITGHALLRALVSLRYREVPVDILEHLDDTAARAYRIADNQLAVSATWNEEYLTAELARLQAATFDLDLLGFAQEDLSRLLGHVERTLALGDESAVPAVPDEPVSRPGDVWLMGEHRLLCGDAMRPEDIQKVLQGELVDLVFADFPSRDTCEQQMKPAVSHTGNDDLGCAFEEFLGLVCRSLLRVCPGALYGCVSPAELHVLQRAFVGAGGHWSAFIIWAWNTFAFGHGDYKRQYEPILYGWREGSGHFWCGARDQGDIWFVNKPPGNDLSGTMKPVELVERAVCNSTAVNDIVLDPFAGPGSTLIAAEKCCRRARLLEIHPACVDVIVRRWQQYCGGQARRACTNETFDQIEQLRQAA